MKNTTVSINEIVQIFVDTGYSKKNTAKRLGISVAALTKKINANPELSEQINNALKDERVEILFKAKEALIEAIQGGDIRAVKLAFETFGAEFGLGAKKEVNVKVQDDSEAVAKAILAKYQNKTDESSKKMKVL